ncbi:hypothetical protein TeGR_g12310, partial [Tetraparma gracilis]
NDDKDDTQAIISIAANRSLSVGRVRAIISLRLEEEEMRRGGEEVFDELGEWVEKDMALEMQDLGSVGVHCVPMNDYLPDYGGFHSHRPPRAGARSEREEEGIAFVKASEKEVQDRERKLEARMIEEEYERRAEEKRMRKPDPERKVPVSEVGRRLIERVVEGKDKTYREQGNNRWKFAFKNVVNEKLKKTHGLPRVADTFIVDTKKTSVRLPDFAAPAEQPEERENKEVHDEPDDTKTHRSVGVDFDFYDMVDDNIISILLDACKPLFDLVNDDLVNDPESKPSTMKPADLLMATAKLIIAAGYKMKEQARQEMAEEDLGGGMFDQDVKGMREFAAKVPLPQVYDADEQRVLDEQLALHEVPRPSLRKYKTGTKLYTCQLADTGSGVDNRDLLNEKILGMIRTTNVLRSAQAKYRFFDEFLFHIIRNAMKRGAVQTAFTVKTHLVALTTNEAGRIARSLVSIIMANATAVAAVDEHIMTFPALGELDREYKWFRPMMESITAELMSQVAYGVKVRAAIGAAASFGDMISDAYMVNAYYVAGRSGPANALLGMVGGNLCFQLIIVTVQTQRLKKDKWRTRFFEFLSVISFMKPGVDAYRVASGAEPATGAAFEPLIEMLYTKGGELVFEAVPGLVVQLVAALTAEKNTTSAYVSLLISTASAALTATTLFWDIDTDPGKRKANPAWVGIVPDLGRGTAFATVFAMCAFHIFAKAAGTALLAVTNPAWLWYYVLGDHGLHFA